MKTPSIVPFLELLDLLSREHADRRSTQCRDEVADSRRGEADTEPLHVLDGPDRLLGGVHVAGLVGEQEKDLEPPCARHRGI
jgi:hypothetical protein